jgi:hypothetical protein
LGNRNVANRSGSEKLTTFDLLMPQLHTSLLLTFRTSAPTEQIIQDLQQALHSAENQIPWISGRVFATEIRLTANDAVPNVIDAGFVDVSYAEAAATALNPKAIPLAKWPLIGTIDDAIAAAGAPVFGAGVFRFADGEGVGICISIHHHVADASGTAEALRIWSENVTGTARNIVVDERMNHNLVCGGPTCIPFGAHYCVNQLLVSVSSLHIKDLHYEHGSHQQDEGEDAGSLEG